MKRNILIIWIILANPAYASDVIDEILVLTEAEESFNVLVEKLIPAPFVDESTQEPIFHEVYYLREQFNENQNRLFDSHFSWASIKDELKRIYFDVYTQEELETLAQFLRSTTGRSILKKQDQLAALYIKVLSERASGYSERHKALMEKYFEQKSQLTNTQ